MSAQILDGRAVAALIRAEVREKAQSFLAKGVKPRLDALVAAQDPSSLAYVRMKRKACAEAGIDGRDVEIDSNTTQPQLIELIQKLNADQNVHGVLIQHPLPKHLDEKAALLALGAEKDVDGITPQSLGRLVADMKGFRCATPLGIIKLLDHYKIPLEGKNALVIGRSVILGKPAAFMLLQKNATVTIAHSKTKNLPELCRSAEILIAAVGKPEMVKGDWIKPGAVVVDAGYNRVEGRNTDVGDVDFDSASKVASWITPVPGGVGPMTVACLLSNLMDAVEHRS